MSSNCLPIIEFTFTFDNLNDPFVLNNFISTKEIVDLLIKSMEIGYNGFEIYRFNEKFKEYVDQLSIPKQCSFFDELKKSIYYYLNPDNYQFKNLQSRINFIEKMKKINFIDINTTNATNINYSNNNNNIMFINNFGILTKVLISKGSIIPSTVLLDLIKNNNIKAFNLLIQFNLIHKKQFLFNYIFKNQYNNKIILYLISIGFLKIKDLSFLIKLSIKSNNFELIDLLLCRNQPQNYPKIIPFQISIAQNEKQEFIKNYLFENYIDSVHYYLLKFRKSYKVIFYLLDNNNYFYSPNQLQELSLKRNCKINSIAYQCHSKTLKEFLKSISYKHQNSNNNNNNNNNYNNEIIDKKYQELKFNF
ncbi:hypothetical protein DDB_G0268694 [Dictyostelium discoideum AX4]|uniref:Uncharacterized protein n=1 Tax=Dictyostelium discoideum TaxID=44689 RepID=Q55F02_DICDI|nr:hypothetical protein DDB_G0268694 [Dictyostelium discoideum AX4]EAL72936.1 hypothetical protein DDB_G0268694 [Dictyostelium discoideum AX4]|eukprot:XP_646868.1 hypothetical protein DDB_G0268694 [Dictyostelium discoideum AX4]